MKTQELKNLFEKDAQNLLHIEPNIVSRNSLYGRLFLIFIALSLLLFGLSLSLQAVLHGLGLYPETNGYWVTKTALYSAIAGVVISFVIRQPLLLFKLLKGKLESESFILQQFKKISIGYSVIYSMCYVATSMFFDFSKYTNLSSLSTFQLDWILFDLRFVHFSSLILSMVFMMFFINYEIERVGLHLVFEGIKTFVGKRNKHLI